MRQLGLVMCTVATAAVTLGAGFLQRGPDAAPPVLDPQVVQDQDAMTWADYKPIPGTRWADNSLTPTERTIRVALIAIDFEDQPFVITQKRQSDPFGNPQVDPVRREDVAKFYASFWGTPGPLNHGHTIHEYWMEQSRGRVGIPKIDAYGPYRMPKRLFEYGLNEYNQAAACPAGFTCNGRMEPDADALWLADAGADIKDKYDVILRIYAGYDETTVWQEFGEMKFRSREDIPEIWGNPDKTKPRWVTTRYVPWTSWLAGAQQWGLSSVRQGESSGTITHELGHLVFRIGDNNNNPYITPYRRVGTGPWDMMDRGSFNGPGGPHRRWVIPAAEGAAMPAGVMLRNRMVMGFLPDLTQIVRLSRDALATSGIAIARVAARAVDPGADAFAGILVRLDGAGPHDRTPACDRTTDPLCAGDPQFNSYSMEVVQRIGYDSFTPDNGVLIVKNKDQQSGSCGYSCHGWVIDAKPADINMLDFVKPDGTRVMRTIADYRQLNDALFHAGVGSGSEFEWRDDANRLHFYIVNVERDARGILFYTLAVRSLDGAGAQTRGVSAGGAFGGINNRINLQITNTGTGTANAAGHPGARPDVFAGDVYRLSVKVTDPQVTVVLRNSLIAIANGRSVSLQLHATRTGAGAPGSVELSIVSESDPTKRATVMVPVK